MPDYHFTRAQFDALVDTFLELRGELEIMLADGIDPAPEFMYALAVYQVEKLIGASGLDANEFEEACFDGIEFEEAEDT